MAAIRWTEWMQSNGFGGLIQRNTQLLKVCPFSTIESPQTVARLEYQTHS